MKFAFIAEKVASFPVRAMCRVMGVSSSGYYASRRREPSQRQTDNELLVLEIKQVHERSRAIYGSPRVTRELRERGRRVSKKRVAKRMKEHGIRSKRRRPFRVTTDSKDTVVAPPNLLNRDFMRTEPNEAWVGDVTAVWTSSGWLYLAVLLDLFSRSVVGWATSAHNDTKLALAALERAVERRRPRSGLLHHTDRGSPYASLDYQARLGRLGMIQSMSRTGDCWDNAVAESFFASLKGEELDHRWIASHSAATRIISEYIENFYNPVRRHSTLDYQSPYEYELRAQLKKLAA